jgi:hypothetical protein
MHRMVEDGAKRPPDQSKKMTDLTLNQDFWIAAGLLLLLAVIGGWREHRRKRRRDIDRPGLVPWQLIEILAFFAAVGAVLLALKL